jgi:hypothetical protein
MNATAAPAAMPPALMIPAIAQYSHRARHSARRVDHRNQLGSAMTAPTASARGRLDEGAWDGLDLPLCGVAYDVNQELHCD